jgi:hypothetical protein
MRERERDWHVTKIGLFALTVCVFMVWIGSACTYSFLHKLFYFLLYVDIKAGIAEYMSHKIINETAAARRKRVNEKK